MLQNILSGKIAKRVQHCQGKKSQIKEFVQEMRKTSKGQVDSLVIQSAII